MVLAIVVTHVAVGVGGALSPVVATAHAAVTAAACLTVMFFSHRPELIVAAVLYAGTSDVFWRMTHSRAPWEFPKYLLALGAVVLLVRFMKGSATTKGPLVFILVLVPAMVITTLSDGLGFARDNISSYELGLVSFGLGVMAFRHIIAGQSDAWNAGWLAVGPLIATLTVTTHALLTTPDIDFSGNSNVAASGGYGPNQVSSSLGLIILVLALLAFLPQARRVWGVMLGVGMWALWGAFLTFSRGGIYSLVLAGSAMLLLGTATRGARVRSIATLVVASVAIYLAFTSANDFSGNWLDTRYENANSTGRSTIAELDMEVFWSHPLLGVGSGRASEFRGQGHLAQAAAHTEFTRVLAEHGVLGIIALGLLASMLIQAYRRSLSHWNRLMIVGLSVWSLTTMIHAATRISAVTLMLALTQVRVETTSSAPDRRSKGPASEPPPPVEHGHLPHSVQVARIAEPSDRIEPLDHQRLPVLPQHNLDGFSPRIQ